MSIPSEAAIPDSKLAQAITQFVRDNETDLLFNHSSRVYQFGALAGLHRDLNFDRELLYAGAMFHDLGLMPEHGSTTERFEVDGANAARNFLKAHGVPEADVYTVWTNGTEKTIAAGEFYTIPPGHDAWVEGDQPYVSLHLLSPPPT